MQTDIIRACSAKVYPPRKEAELRSLHQIICDSNMSSHHKLSVFYYLLLDYDAARDRSQLAETFARRSGVPEKYQTFMTGLWHLDRQQFDVTSPSQSLFPRPLLAYTTPTKQDALEYLTHPSLIPEFADDVIAVLIRHRRADLALAYHATVQPVLKSPRSLELLFDAMASSGSGASVSMAFFWARAHAPDAAGPGTPTRQVLLQRLVATVLGKPSGAAAAGGADVQQGQQQQGQHQGEERARAAAELVGLPFDADEERWFEDYLLRGEGRRLRRAKETVLLRRVVTLRYDGGQAAVDAAMAAGDKDAKGNAARWGALAEGFRSAGMGAGVGR